MEKVLYEVDPFNRLVVTGGGGSLKRYRRVIDGTFKIGADNSLSYHSKSPLDGAAVPYQIRLRGSWSLSKAHDLRLTLDGHKLKPGGGTLTLTGDIIAARGDRLQFAVTTKTADGLKTTYVVELGGTWFADANNRLAFAVQRTSGRSDTLVFNASWTINKYNELSYRYEKAERRKGVRRVRDLIFKGRWQVTKSSALTYLVESSSDSSFNFRTGIARCTDKGITYEVAIGLKRTLRPAVKTVAILGRWKPSDNSTLTLEIETAGGRVYALKFAVEARLGTRNKVTFLLKNPAGTASLDMELGVTRKLIRGDGDAFLRLIRSNHESAILAGAAFRW